MNYIRAFINYNLQINTSNLKNQEYNILLSFCFLLPIYFSNKLLCERRIYSAFSIIILSILYHSSLYISKRPKLIIFFRIINTINAQLVSLYYTYKCAYLNIYYIGGLIGIFKLIFIYYYLNLAQEDRIYHCLIHIISSVAISMALISCSINNSGECKKNYINDY